ncbi:MAG: NAD(P)-dependent oxidoreductase [Acidimicrobiia bacterium]
MQRCSSTWTRPSMYRASKSSRRCSRKPRGGTLALNEYLLTPQAVSDRVRLRGLSISPRSDPDLEFAVVVFTPHTQGLGYPQRHVVNANCRVPATRIFSAALFSRSGDQMQVGFIGLGDMGQIIVPRLLHAGHSVTGWNRTETKALPLVELGMRLAASPREVAAGSDVVFSMVTDAAAVRAVALGEEAVIAGLGPGSVYLDMSTIGPEESRAISAEFGASGLTMLDAPLSGSPITVSRGEASIMVGGDRSAFERVEPILLDIGSTANYIGESGMAAQMKVAINLALIVEMVVFCEAVALAEKGGVARDVAVDAMLKSVVASPVMAYRGPFILEGNMPDKPMASVTLQQKDMLLALDLGRRQGAPVPLAAAANEMLNACHGLGIDHRDFVTVFDVYRTMSGMSS